MARYRMAFDTIEEAQAFITGSPFKNEHYEIHVVFENDRLERMRTRSAAPVKRRKKAVEPEIKSSVVDVT